MQNRDAVFLEDLCPKLKDRCWRQSLHRFTSKCCIYCGNSSESIDHINPRSRGGLSITENCVPACLACNGDKSDSDAFDWYRRQRFYDPRRAMAIRAWMDGDLRLALRLLQWVQPTTNYLNKEKIEFSQLQFTNEFEFSASNLSHLFQALAKSDNDLYQLGSG